MYPVKGPIPLYHNSLPRARPLAYTFLQTQPRAPPNDSRSVRVPSGEGGPEAKEKIARTLRATTPQQRPQVCVQQDGQNPRDEKGHSHQGLRYTSSCAPITRCTQTRSPVSGCSSKWNVQRHFWLTRPDQTPGYPSMRSIARLGCDISWQNRANALRACALTDGGSASNALLNRRVLTCRIATPGSPESRRRYQRFPRDQQPGPLRLPAQRPATRLSKTTPALA